MNTYSECEACDTPHNEIGYYCAKCQKAIDALHKEMKSREDELTPEQVYELRSLATKQTC